MIKLEELKLLDVLARPDVPSFIESLGEMNAVFLPEVWKLRLIGDDGHKDNYAHTLKVLQNVIDGESGIDMGLRLVALFHDVGKANSKRVVENGKVTFHGHEEESARMLPAALARHFIRMDDSMLRVQKIIRMHGRPKAVPKWATDSAVKRLAVEAGDVLESLFAFCKCDTTTTSLEKRSRYIKHIDFLEERRLEISKREEQEAYRPPVDGYDIMDLLTKHSINDRKLVGVIKKDIIDSIRSGRLIENRGACLDYIRSKYIRD